MKPGIYIPTLYLASGLPYTIVCMMSNVYFKNMHADNEFIGAITTLLQIPWSIKLFWAPMVDLYGTRRQWIVVSQLVLGVLIACLAGVAQTTNPDQVQLAVAEIGRLAHTVVGQHSGFQLPAVPTIPDPLKLSVAIFAFLALLSATQDISIDGYYMDVLDGKQQSFYVGIRNTAYRVAMLLGSGALVFLAGKLAEMGYGVSAGWCVSFAVCSAILVAASLFHNLVLPRPEQVKRNSLTMSEFLKVFKTFFDQPRIVVIVLYILTFRLGDALMLKMAQLFLLDTVEKGGLAISTANVGIIYGTIGTMSLLAGGLLCGWLVSKYGLKKCLLPTAIIQNSAILLYWMLAIFKPHSSEPGIVLDWVPLLEPLRLNPHLVAVAIVNAYEQFAYGLGFTAYTVFLLSTVKPEYKAAHYATATALMALGLLIPGYVSGYLQTWLGYRDYFLLSFFASIPGIITIFYLPLKKGVENPA